jgi:hypothetical protein
MVLQFRQLDKVSLQGTHYSMCAVHEVIVAKTSAAVMLMHVYLAIHYCCCCYRRQLDAVYAY